MTHVIILKPRFIMGNSINVYQIILTPHLQFLIEKEFNYNKLYIIFSSNYGMVYVVKFLIFVIITSKKIFIIIFNTLQCKKDIQRIKCELL